MKHGEPTKTPTNTTRLISKKRSKQRANGSLLKERRAKRIVVFGLNTHSIRLYSMFIYIPILVLHHLLLCMTSKIATNWI